MTFQASRRKPFVLRTRKKDTANEVRVVTHIIGGTNNFMGEESRQTGKGGERNQNDWARGATKKSN